MSPETNYCWIKKPLEVVDPDLDYERPETNWAKIIRINPTEWLCLMGAQINEDTMSQIGTKTVSKLNIETGRLTWLTECPERMMAHQCIFLPPTSQCLKGAVYCFGGL